MSLFTTILPDCTKVDNFEVDDAETDNWLLWGVDGGVFVGELNCFTYWDVFELATLVCPITLVAPRYTFKEEFDEELSCTNVDKFDLLSVVSFPSEELWGILSLSSSYQLIYWKLFVLWFFNLFTYLNSLPIMFYLTISFSYYPSFVVSPFRYLLLLILHWVSSFASSLEVTF